MIVNCLLNKVISTTITFLLVIIGFQRRSYMVNEDAGSVEVCAMVTFGSFRNPDFVTFRMTTGLRSKFMYDLAIH